MSLEGVRRAVTRQMGTQFHGGGLGAPALWSGGLQRGSWPLYSLPTGSTQVMHFL